MFDNIAFGIVIGSLFITFVVLFCAILIKLYIQKIKNYTRLIYQKDIDFQKSLTTTVIETQEQVLNNISRDLHDDAGQQLTYINFQLENLKLDSADLQETLQPLSESVGQLSESIRSISHSLNNQLLTQQDLLKAIESEVTRLQKNSRLEINYIADDTGRDFSTNEKIVIYRIFQETINNSMKHARAKSITVTIANTPFTMTVADDGKGFDASAINGKSSLGLLNMRERASIIGFGLDIESTPGNGTKITLSEKANHG